MIAHKNLLVFGFALAFVGLCQAQVVTDGECSCDVTVVENFNVVKYLGLWYEYSKYPAYFEGNGKCITAQYSLQEDGNVGVLNTQVDPTTNKVQDIKGFAEPIENAKLLVTFPVSPAFNATSNYWVLDTDYVNYSVVYACQNTDANKHSTIVWILTREREPCQEIVDKATSVLVKNKVDLKPLVKTVQSGC